MSSQTKTSGNGIGFLGLLAIVFITLKLCNVINWSWWWVTSPLWGGVAIEALKFGLAIRRKGWNGKGLWVIKQVPAHIESDIVPKMQSLPQSAKDLILKGKGFINYTSQCLIYNENTGRADSWIPSISDVFAEDWEIVQQ